MSISDSDSPSGSEHILPVGDRQLERIQPDGSLIVRVLAVGDPTARPAETRVLDLSLHGVLLTAIPGLSQGDLIDLIDLEPQPIRASVVRQSDLGTHVSFVDHIQPRLRARRPDANRRRHPRVPCETPVTLDDAVGTVLNASLGGVLVRVAAPGEWSVGDRLKLSIDAHDQPLVGVVVAVMDDRLSIRFVEPQDKLRIAAADCVITLEQRAAKPRARATPKRKAPPKKAATKAPAKKAPPKKAAIQAPPARKTAAKPKPAVRAKPRAKAKAQTGKTPAKKARAKAKTSKAKSRRR